LRAVATKWRPRGATTKDTMVCIWPCDRPPGVGERFHPERHRGAALAPSIYPNPKILGAK
jgi:hypothetical protein